MSVETLGSTDIAGLLAQIAAADRRKDEFLAMLGHELRNLLSPISAGLQILSMPDVETELAAQARDVMARHVEHMTRLLDDLLDVSRISRGTIELRREPVEMCDLLTRAVETSHPIIEARQHTLILKLPPELIEIEGDPVRLTQVFSNLLNNAAKYTDPGGQITVSVTCDPNEAFVVVADNGIGISAQMLPRIFDLFVQVDPARGSRGLGLGLTLVRRLVELHNGTVHAASAGLNRGTSFTVRLPRRKAAQLEPMQPKLTPISVSRAVVSAASAGDHDPPVLMQPHG